MPAASLSAPAPQAGRAAVLAAHRVSVALEGNVILHSIDLSVAAGQFVALLGANGSGKSTLARACVGILPCQEGRVELFGSDLAANRSPLDRVGYVPQRQTAPSALPATAFEVVASGLRTRSLFARLGRAEKRQRVMAALTEVALAHRAHEPVSIFSGGQAQRVLVARALVRQPQLLVLDEPLTGMDAHSRENLAATLTRLRQRGTAILCVLHEPGELGPLIDQAVRLAGGHIHSVEMLPRLQEDACF
ncbi:metal ABC transporter ATP-binding protein [Buchananella hordeovulneris]|uniref:ABC transporter domain-containing protein n=1 Tax=Buchananella hordeovulneris TaxID=52770 RepID=A0A1Q5PX43_9ACTO|nr:metal ABC transporter ATP-binding protein [Buchananella hordeovulneris]MDO5080376.1 metal ABC transporter ATP-binding protein [Buchananella hordeovulneris]OKL52032.1 hypothetical protein BSZ40_03640 [Buchananella hordeovulneris]RRD52572.1 metal ABC transporter ATP-binding protein [Buchananella hordeovulneris]